MKGREKTIPRAARDFLKAICQVLELETNQMMLSKVRNAADFIPLPSYT